MIADNLPEGNFAAIDFETADYGRDSACAVALVKVEGNRIVRRFYQLIKPPRRNFVFSYLHGITWADVVCKPSFGEVWPLLSEMLQDVAFLTAHNASFDKSVLCACCEASGMRPPALPFLCTVKLARRAWNIYPTKLNIVCRHLSISLNHHHAASDAEACARIVLAARRRDYV